MVCEVAEGALHPHVVLAGVGAVVAWLIFGLSIALLRRLAYGQAATGAATGATTGRAG